MGTYSDYYKKAKKNGTLDNISTRYVKEVKKGDVFVGKLLSIDLNHSKQFESDYNSYQIKTDSEVIRLICGAVVDRDVAPQMKPGEVYAFEYLGVREIPGGNQVKEWRVDAIHADVEA